MPDVLDLLLIFPNNRARAYGELGVDIAGVIPPVQSGLTAAYLRERGYSVKILDADALEKYLTSLEDERPYQLIFLDIMMPKMNGIEVMERIRERELQSGVLGDDAVNIVMTTAVDDEQKIFEAHVTGCFNYLIKPLDKKSVVEQLKFVEKSNTLQQ